MQYYEGIYKSMMVLKTLPLSVLHQYQVRMSDTGQQGWSHACRCQEHHF